MKICVATPLYALSGVALAQIRFAQALSRRGHDVDLLIGRIDPDLETPPIEGVNVIKLYRANVRAMFLPIFNYLRTVKPDIVFPAEDHLTAVTLLAAIASGSRAKISGSSRITPNDAYSNERFSKRWLLKQAVRAVMWRADALTCVTTGMVAQYRAIFPNAPHVCVYNIVGDEISRTRMLEPLDHPWIDDGEGPLLVAAGALAPWKGFADLIRAAKLLSARRRFRLLILGDGPLRDELQRLIDDLDLGRIVRLEGFVSNPLKYYVRADVFVLSSLLEGMPNVLLESMMCGCTPVSTDCPTGPREALMDGRYGYLVPVGYPEALAAGIEKALDHPLPPDLLREGILRFDETAVIDRHFKLLGISDGADQSPAER